MVCRGVEEEVGQDATETSAAPKPQDTQGEDFPKQATARAGVKSAPASPPWSKPAGPRTEDRGQRTEDRGQRTEDRDRKQRRALHVPPPTLGLLPGVIFDMSIL